jgi:hypothetical protein
MRFPGTKEARHLGCKNKKVTEVLYHGAKYTRDMVEQEVARLQRRYPGKEFQVALLYDRPMSSQSFSSADPVLLYSLLDTYDESQIPDIEYPDPTSYDMFWVYISEPKATVGGCNPKGDGLNDCLYNCLKMAYGTKWKLPQAIKTPELLKERLRLQRTDPIPIQLIAEIEVTSAICINVTGDHYYQSNKKYKRNITLVLANGHYSLARNPKRQRAKWYRKPGQTVAYKERFKSQDVELYDGKKCWTQPLIEFREQIYKSPEYSFIQVRKKKDRNLETVEEAFYRFNEERNALLEKSKKFGLPMDINMCGGSEKVMALWLFERCSQAIPANEPLDPQEAHWISDTMRGGLIWANNEWKGYGRQYDFTSMYPYLLQKYFFPVKKGKFRILQDYRYDNRGINMAYYGIFRAEVEYSADVTNVFSYSKKNKYTHYDLNNARALGLNYSLIQDGFPNALVYDTKAIFPGSVMFGAIIDLLFQIKCEGGPAGQIAKRIINIIWGALSQRSYTYEPESETFNIPEGAIVKEYQPIGYKKVLFKLSYPDKIFKGEYPRIAPFLTSMARETVSKAIQPYKNQVRRVHTDGFILEEDPNQLPLITCPDNAPKTLGALKYEKEGECYVKNANQVAWSDPLEMA